MLTYEDVDVQNIGNFNAFGSHGCKHAALESCFCSGGEGNAVVERIMLHSEVNSGYFGRLIYEILRDLKSN